MVSNRIFHKHKYNSHIAYINRNNDNNNNNNGHITDINTNNNNNIKSNNNVYIENDTTNNNNNNVKSNSNCNNNIKNSLKVYYCNARSLRKKDKFNELIGLITVNEYDIVCITESWISQTYNKDLLGDYQIKGYNMYIYERIHRQGGGVVMYAKNNLSVSEVGNIKNDIGVESLWVDIKSNKNITIRVGLFYRAPDSNFDINNTIINEINTGLQNIGNNPAIILGDFNLPDINWNLHIGRNEDVEFLNCLHDNFLDQLINFNTRGNNILDLLFTNDSNLVSSLTSSPPLDNSDHSSFIFNLNVSTQRNENKELKYNYNKGDFNKFRTLLSEIDWVEKFENKTCNEMWEIFKLNLENTQNLCIPKVKIRSSKKLKPTWWNNDIKKLIKDKKVAWDRVVKNNYQECDLQVFRIKRDLVKTEIRKAERLDIIKLSNDIKNNKKFFGYFNVKRKLKNKISNLKCQGLTVDGDENIVNELNNYFSSVFNKTNTDNLNNLQQEEEDILGNINSINNINVTSDMVKKIILSLDVNKACGPDGIGSRVLKEGVDNLSLGLSIIYNKSLQSAQVPLDWKVGNVVPIFKKGNKECVENYRPVSLTSVACRILERVIKENVVSFLDRYKLVLKSQHGFTKNRSCLTNLLEYINYVTEVIDSGKPVDVVYLDFSKAFDRVCHRRLIYKLWKLGIRGEILDWITEWLQNRKQRVVLNGVKSGWKDVDSGVPQGSVLGPLLFTLFVNDIDLGLDCQIWKFADDTKIVRAVENSEDCFRQQRNLDRLVSWGDKWKMNFNVGKCKVMHIGNNNLKFGYLMNGEWLDETDCEKDLGVMIDSNLKSGRQVLEARNKANRMLGFITRNLSYKSKEVIKKLYNAYVRPHLEYCIQVWSPYYRHDLDMLESVQRRATRLIPGFSRLEYRDRLKKLDMFSVRRRYLRGDMIQVYKMFEGIDDININDFFEIAIDSSTRGHNRKLKTKYSRLDCRKYSFSLRVVDLWNRLGSDTVNSKSISAFKCHLDQDMSNLGYW